MNIKFLFLFSFCFSFFSCDKSDQIDRPNVILIMSDDLGHEAIGINGATEYNTPVLDSLAVNGINFNNAYSQPLCTPSRVKIMTGKPNYINYEYLTDLTFKLYKGLISNLFFFLDYFSSRAFYFGLYCCSQV